MFRFVRALPHIEIERKSDPARVSLCTVNSSEHCCSGERCSCRVRVKGGKAQNEHIMSALPPKADLPPDLRTAPAASSSRTPPSRPRASPRVAQYGQAQFLRVSHFPSARLFLGTGRGRPRSIVDPRTDTFNQGSALNRGGSSEPRSRDPYRRRGSFLISRRQLLANAAIAASHVGS